MKTELRHLPSTGRHQLISLLDIKDNWKILATIIPNPDHPDRLLLRSNDVSVLEEQRKKPNGSPANSLLLHWSTYGRRRHTLGDAIRFLEEAGLHREADIIRNCIDEYNANRLDKSSSASLISSERLQKSSFSDWKDLPAYCFQSNQTESAIKPTAPNESLISFTTLATSGQSLNDYDQSTLLRFPYRLLEIATDDFGDEFIQQGGTKLGEGSFGEVFRCSTKLFPYDFINQCEYVAVKRFKNLKSNDSENFGEFLSELNTMYRFKHPNLVKLHGYSNDGPFFCIVTEYLENGSLHSYLFNSDPTKNVLNFEQRLKIIIDLADAIVYLHTFKVNGRKQEPFVHRDIKSANVLLDGNFTARLADLGLVRKGSSSNNDTTIVTQTIKGTSVYMAPEAFRGDVSVKIDTFSFGVVTLEILTGKTAFDTDRDETDMVSYIDEMLGDEFDRLSFFYSGLKQYIEESYKIINKDKLLKILDPKCETWNISIACKLVIMCKCCIEQRKRNRPTMLEVREFLKYL